MEILVLSSGELRQVVDPAAARAAMREAFSALSAGRAVVPDRICLETEAGRTLFMPAALERPQRAGDLPTEALGAKIVSVFETNPGRGLPRVSGVVVLVDAMTGRPRALLDGTALTSLRTAAASALATECLADAEAGVLAVFGAGAQGRAHIEALRAVRPIRELRLVSRTRESAERLAGALQGIRVRVLEDAEAALRGAEIVVTATTSTTPLFAGATLERGAHVNAIGAYLPTAREVDTETVRRARVVVDSRAAALREAGDLLIPIREGAIAESHIDAELGEILNGDAPGGRGGREVSLFKSVGSAAQDVAIAERAAAAAERRGVGRLLEL